MACGGGRRSSERRRCAAWEEASGGGRRCGGGGRREGPIYRLNEAVGEERGGGGGRRARQGAINGARPLARVGDATARAMGTWRGRLRSSASSCAGSRVAADAVRAVLLRRAARRGGQATGWVGERHD